MELIQKIKALAPPEEIAKVLPEPQKFHRNTQTGFNAFHIAARVNYPEAHRKRVLAMLANAYPDHIGVRDNDGRTFIDHIQGRRLKEVIKKAVSRKGVEKLLFVAKYAKNSLIARTSYNVKRHICEFI